MFRQSVLVFSLLGLFSVTNGQILQNAQCDPNLSLQANFNPETFSGTWYEVGRTSPAEDGSCSTFTISRENTTTTAFNFTYSAVNRNFREENTLPATLTAGTAQFSLNIGGGIPDADFWILGTNYNDYAFGYRCENVNDTHRNVYLWHLGRESEISPNLNNIMNNVIMFALNISLSDLSSVDHSPNACFALPSIPSGQAVVIPGQCDHNISLLNTFDPATFLGTWHEIYSYHSENVLGTCARAQYSLGTGGVVNVVNSQVINQTLATISGIARVSNESNARLIVTLEVQPNVFQDQDLWIIDTDYNNYAISYSCSDVSNDTKRVFSWILSRTRDLSPASDTAVRNVVDSILDLNFFYYEETNRTDTDCFYFPEPAPDRIVEFRGPCDLTIPAVPNFNATLYQGLWHDIESYPSGFQEGTCNNAEYDLVNGVVDVFNTQVINQTLFTMSGVAVLAPDSNGTGKLEVTFPVEGTNNTITTNYWILDTDYTNHSLVYTCQYNNATDTKQVWSWKLSRSRTLTAASNIAINAVIATIPVLDDRYYVSRNHSQEACFYYPQHIPGEPLRFPGQCDLNIPAVFNFNQSLFQGSWYEVDTYPKEESGDCVTHSYSLGDNDILNLISTFNVEQFLQSSSSVLRRNPGDNSGRFTVSINVGNNQVIEIPFWILYIDSDYNDFALAYSCINDGIYNRAAYFWKLSRNQQLSAIGQTTINNYINNSTIDVLDNRYFEPVDHSTNACASLLEIAPGQPIIIDGQCDLNIPAVPNFDAGRYVGLWHMVESYPSEFQNGNCNDATYTAQADGSVLVFNTEVINQTLDTITGVARLAPNSNGTGKLTVSFPNASDIEYWIIATDYVSYSIVYSCINITNNTQRVWSWKLGRNRFLTPNATESINQSIRDIRVLNNRYYYNVNNSDQACFYLPTPDGNPVFFRGQCNENIPVVTNFNAVAYMGDWYDIESYPQQFQEGTCSTANYSLRDGGVDVFNTQVVNQTLDTIVGRAELIPSNDGSAMLNVSFPIGQTNLTTYSPYWVLATDYNNYALVYSCQNQGPDSRYVSSWKLSRERTLSQASQNAINNVTEGIEVLNQMYYQLKGHSDEQCFYYPEPTGNPVVFRGSCSNNVQAVPNFNLTNFAGDWIEIETYPKEQVGGQCVHHNFNLTAFNNTLELISNQVFNSETLVSNNGQITLVSTDGSGRFTLSLSVNNQNIVIPYWILATDYAGYALAYSCMDLANNTRAVYSWKLSRTRQLSNAANVAINTALGAVDVLDQRYYEPVTQTDAACFHLPEIAPNQPVILPGQCDQNISVIQNFSASNFAGRWFDIESYFDNYQGSCIDGSFNLSGNGYDVLLTQVANQSLDTTASRATFAADNSGRLIVTVGGTQVEYYILGTDYTSWSLIYSCQNVGNNQRRVRSWKLSRTRQLTANASLAINNIVNNTDVLNQQYFNIRNHSDAACFYYPVADGRPVRFRGRCDLTIPVVQNFSAADYLGTWYDIESYPQEFQDGECSTALYSLGNGVVDVYNTQVVNQQLDTMNGTAIVVSNDGSARLNVTFVVGGIPMTTPYWVLATDYNTYSFVYSCFEVDAEYMRVAAWKLSRTRNLTLNANDVINNVISNFNVLQPQYFEPTGHTDQDCFFYPDNNGGPVILDGQCPQSDQISVVTNFTANAFAGSWYEVSRFPSELQNGECASGQFATTIQNTFSLTQNIVLNETLVTITGNGTVPANGTGLISATFNAGQTTTAFNAYILDTDYNEFALIYSCRNLNNVSKQIYSWKLSRNRNGLSQTANDRINDIVSSNEDLFELYYDSTNQDNDACFYYPDFGQLPNVIVLPGYCPTRIRGMPNFDAAAYLGRWFEIEKYPQPFQFGECSRAEYSQGNNTVNVYNTQVVNNTLLVQNGTAVVASTDGTGQLSVTFVVNGTTNVASYYVLGTDYNSYALVYNCRNLTDGNREVFSWKLSRNRTLSNAANQAINSIMADTQGLRQDLFTSTSQSDEDCFYLPEPNPEQFVVVRGQCGNITGVQNFDIQRYLGAWHEVERYPTGADDGVCTRANFTSSGANQYQVVDTSVFGLNAQTYLNAVTATADGRLRRTMELDGAIGVTDTWVLATDYDTYALLYSCVNYNSEYRQVWSAKHSRTRTMPPAAQNATAQVIADHRVLDQRYFVPVDQSDAGCFHYPEPTGQPVTLPGQCDVNIPVVQDFNAAEYSGRWYQIERYPQAYESGNCTGARYTLDEQTEVVTVQNWQVIDGALDVIVGNATITSSDGSARLLVTLPSRAVEGENATMELFVLTTDYVSYSLTYSCENINQYERRVAAWKLSRNRNMPAASATQINAYMAQREELDQRYYITVGQNEDCPEPSSSYLIRSSIIMLLVCSILQLLN